MDRPSDDRDVHEAGAERLPTEAEMVAIESVVDRAVAAVSATVEVRLEDAVLEAVRPLARRRAWWRWLPVAVSAAVVSAGAVLLEMVPTGATLAAMPRRSVAGGLQAVASLIEGWRTVLVTISSVDVPALARGTATVVVVVGATLTAVLLRRWRKVAAWRRID